MLLSPSAILLVGDVTHFSGRRAAFWACLVKAFSAVSAKLLGVGMPESTPVAKEFLIPFSRRSFDLGFQWSFFFRPPYAPRPPNTD